MLLLPCLLHVPSQGHPFSQGASAEQPAHLASCLLASLLQGRVAAGPQPSLRASTCLWGTSAFWWRQVPTADICRAAAVRPAIAAASHAPFETTTSSAARAPPLQRHACMLSPGASAHASTHSHLAPAVCAQQQRAIHARLAVEASALGHLPDAAAAAYLSSPVSAPSCMAGSTH